MHRSDLENRSLGVGDPNSPDRGVGKDKARRSKVDLTGGGSVAGTIKEYDLAHDLGEVPTAVELATWENAAVAGTFIEAVGVRQSNWSHSHCHVSIRLVSGSFDGCSASFIVRGK